MKKLFAILLIHLTMTSFAQSTINDKDKEAYYKRLRDEAYTSNANCVRQCAPSGSGHSHGIENADPCKNSNPICKCECACTTKYQNALFNYRKTRTRLEKHYVKTSRRKRKTEELQRKSEQLQSETDQRVEKSQQTGTAINDAIDEIGNLILKGRKEKQERTDAYKEAQSNSKSNDGFNGKDNISSEDNSYQTDLNEGIQEFKKKEYVGALMAFTAAINGNTNHYEAYYRRGLTYYYLKTYDEAMKDFNIALKTPGNHHGLVLVFRGATKLKTNQLESACNDFYQSQSLGFIEANSYINENCKNNSDLKNYNNNNNNSIFIEKELFNKEAVINSLDKKEGLGNYKLGGELSLYKNDLKFSFTDAETKLSYYEPKFSKFIFFDKNINHVFLIFNKDKLVKIQFEPTLSKEEVLSLIESIRESFGPYIKLPHSDNMFQYRWAGKKNTFSLFIEKELMVHAPNTIFMVLEKTVK